MAARGTPKYFSIMQENKIAALYDGIRSASSGAADTDQGDIRTKELLIECKTTGGPGKRNTKPVFIQNLEKVAAEAYTEGREPLLALRYYDPKSILSDGDGWIDVVVRRASEDAYR